MEQQGTPPWHMWGSEQVVNLQAAGATTNQSSSPQLARINYKRPETWTFIFIAKLLAGAPSGPTSAVFIRYDLTLGVGRASTTIQGFRTFTITWTAAPPLNVPFIATTAPNNISTVTPSPSDGFIETFPASEIQCQAFVVIPATNPAVSVSVAAYFAPRTHVRPDWYGQKAHFNGGEAGGR